MRLFSPKSIVVAGCFVLLLTWATLCAPQLTPCPATNNVPTMIYGTVIPVPGSGKGTP
jgi:hypothetical protein